MKPKKVRRLLRIAQESQEPVIIHGTRASRLRNAYGIVVGQTDEWAVLHALAEGVYLDDLVLLRLDHIKRVKRHPNRTLINRAIEGLGDPVETLECAPTANTHDLLALVAERQGLVSVHHHQSLEDHRWSEIGMIREVGRQRVLFHAIKDDGTWADEPGARRSEGITRLAFGGRYLRALEQFGDPAPELSGMGHVILSELTKRSKKDGRA